MRRSRHKLLFFILCVLTAATSPDTWGGSSSRVAHATRITSPPIIDGDLSDSVWALAMPVVGFTQRDPDEGKPATEETEIRILYDDRALYFGCMFYDSDPVGIVKRLMRRDEEGESDWGSIRLDTHHDHRNAYEFTFNPAGVKVDILQFDDGEREDESWDVVWDLETKIDERGWSAEVRIPFSVLRYSLDPVDSGTIEWGINFIRTINRKKETSRWAFTPKKESGFISRFGHLTGLRDVPSPQRFEIKPFLVARQESQPASDLRPPSTSFTPLAGLDIKMGIGDNLMLDVTFNPDFGQVEADPAVLNLSTVETFYPEKRPFFVEGTQIFQFNTFGGGSGMFYSRRVGRAISPGEVQLSQGEHIKDLPQTTTILGAAKLSGKLPGGTSIGVLQAVTRREFAVIEGQGSTRREQVLEPLAHFNVVRVRQDVLNGSYVGGIFTSTAKETREPAFTGGADWSLRLDNGIYQCAGFIAGSYAGTMGWDRTSGSAGKAEFARIGAEHWLWSADVDFTSPGYNINDVGYFRRPNDYGAMATLKYKEDVPAAVVRNFNVALNLHERRNFDGANLNHDIQLQSVLQFTNYWMLVAATQFGFGTYDDRETRGNGLYAKPSSGEASAELETDERRPVSFHLTQELMWNAKAKWGTATGIGVEVRPSSWMEWDIVTKYKRVKREEAWVENVPFADDRASIFGDRTTEELDLQLRGSVTFTRDMTLQLYSQLFLAKGQYEGFRRLVGTSMFESYGYQRSSAFNSESLRLNLVFRWEYVPGSTVYLVWSHAREGGRNDFFTSLGDDMAETFRLPPANVLLLKLTYWWNV